MKIAILTHQLTNNYGGILQNFALQKYLYNLGHDVVTIDYIKNLSFKIKVFSIIKRLALKLICNSKLPLRGWTTLKEEEIISQHTRKFVDNYIKTTERLSINSISKLKCDFDAIIVGSDQVWRYKYLGKSILEFFLCSFPSVKYKLSYAASFGTDNWEMPQNITNKCQKLIAEFDGVSVREDSGILLCEKYLNTTAVHVLDPTLLLSKNQYVELIDNAKTVKYNNIVMTYILDKTLEKREMIEYVSNRLKLSPIEILPSFKYSDVGHQCLESCIVPPIEEWLRGFMDAEFVVTDSFHGTVFSIIFNKPFVVIGNENRGLSRMSSLLRLFGLEERLISSKNEIDMLLSKAIDWDCVNDIWNKKRDESVNFILKTLNL